MSLVILGASLAFADEPTVEVDGSLVRGRAHLAVPPQRVLAELRDPAWELRVSGDGTRMEAVTQAGDCQRVAYVSPNAIRDAIYEVRRCPTADGWEGTMVTSNVFSRYRVRWRAEPEGAGSRVTYEIDLATTLMVPASLVRGEVRRSVLKLMGALAAWGDAASPE